MKTYIGTKVINAKPMTREAYNILRGWQLPENEVGKDEGYLVEYTDGGKPNLSGYTGYVSWSPKEQFDKAYRETSGLSFGMAVEALKKGARIARSGWNGKGMWLSLSCNPGGDSAAGRREIAFENFWSNNNSEFARQNGGSAVVLPCITMKTADNAILMGWLASQTDILADDWAIV